MAPTNPEFDRYIERLTAPLPPRLRRAIERLRRPEARWLRRAVAVLFILGGMLWFLPVVGLWMLPLGLILIAEDHPWLKRKLARIFMAAEKAWTKWRRR